MLNVNDTIIGTPSNCLKCLINFQYIEYLFGKDIVVVFFVLVSQRIDFQSFYILCMYRTGFNPGFESPSGRDIFCL